MSINQVGGFHLNDAIVNGFTFGTRFYKNEPNFYLDLQQSLGGALGYGVGINIKTSEDTATVSHYRFKMWGGVFVLGTYDLMFPRKDDGKYWDSLGLVGTLPITN